jgi:nucleotide-binding universal stress UspA family protein
MARGCRTATEEPFMKILLPVDGSEYTRRMLAYIAAHDELLGKGHGYLERGVLDDHYREQAEQVLAPVKAFAAQNGWTLRTAWQAGHAADAIAACADSEKPDLIVMGTHGHSALGTMLLGSVTSGVLARCKTAPVLLIR